MQVFPIFWSHYENNLDRNIDLGKGRNIHDMKIMLTENGHIRDIMSAHYQNNVQIFEIFAHYFGICKNEADIMYVSGRNRTVGLVIAV